MDVPPYLMVNVECGPPASTHSRGIEGSDRAAITAPSPIRSFGWLHPLLRVSIRVVGDNTSRGHRAE
jgi:hypothetical protein